jgi:hypothetical protein
LLGELDLQLPPTGGPATSDIQSKPHPQVTADRQFLHSGPIPTVTAGRVLDGKGKSKFR